MHRQTRRQMHRPPRCENLVRVRVALVVYVGACLVGCGGAAVSTAELAPSGPQLRAPETVDTGARGAAYLSAVATAMQPAWGQFLEDCRLRLPRAHALNAQGLAATAELAIARDGRVLAVRLAPGSGNADFDRAVRDVIRDAAPLPRPPLELESDDGATHVTWLFARDRRQAGPATAHVRAVHQPLLGVVDRYLANGAVVRAAHRVSETPPGDPAREIAAERVMIAVLREAVTGAPGPARRAAVEAIGRAQLHALAPAVHLLVVPDGDRELRLAAIATTAALADPAPALTLREADLRDDGELAMTTVRALAALGRSAEVAPVVRAVLASKPLPTAIMALGVVPDPALAGKLGRWAYHREPAVRAAVCGALPAAAPQAAVDVVADGLRDPDAGVRARCAEAAARVGSSRRLAIWLTRLARDRDRVVRAGAVAALAVVAPGARRPVDDPAHEVRLAAVRGASEAELRTLAGDPEAEVRAAALGVLGERAGELAVKAARDPSASVRRAAIAVLANPDLLARMASDDSPEVATAAQVRLAALRGRAASTGPLLRQLIASSTGPARVRIALAWLLAR